MTLPPVSFNVSHLEPNSNPVFRSGPCCLPPNLHPCRPLQVQAIFKPVGSELCPHRSALVLSFVTASLISCYTINRSKTIGSCLELQAAIGSPSKMRHATPHKLHLEASSCLHQPCQTHLLKLVPDLKYWRRMEDFKLLNGQILWPWSFNSNLLGGLIHWSFFQWIHHLIVHTRNSGF